MRVLIQRVSEADVSIDGDVVGAVQRGLLVLCGIGEGDAAEDVEWIAQKVVQMRIFADENGRMNRSVLEIQGGILVVSQFTLHASTRKGNRPSFIGAARPEVAVPLYENFIGELERLLGKPVASGRFGAEMAVRLVNDGPVTLWMDSRAKE